MKEKITLNEFKEALARNGINVVLRQNANGNIYGITYVDLKNKCVFNGSDLGKEFSAKGILQQLRPEQKKEVEEQSQLQKKQVKDIIVPSRQSENIRGHEQNNQDQHKVVKLNALEALLKPEETTNYIPNQLLKKKRQKKKSGGLHL